ncbi:MAG: SufD family Fe-S cluster assembly protein [Nitrososphaeria archaeon]
MGSRARIEALNKRASESLAFKPKYGPDIELSKYLKQIPHSEKVDRINALPETLTSKMQNIGIDTKEESKAGSYVQLDHDIVYKKRFYPNVELLTLEEALNDEDFVENYYWRLIDVGQDKFTAAAQLYGHGGYVIKTEEEQKLDVPIQACLLIKSPEAFQAPHNVIVAEAGSTLHVVTGCAVMPESVGLHAGITEFYVKRNATVTFTMIHDWNKVSDVRPRTTAVVEEGGVFINNYINLSPSGLRSLQAYPTVVLKGDNSRAFMSSIVIGSASSYIDLGSAITIMGKGSKAEIVSRSISKDQAQIVARARITAQAPNSKGHIECRGLMLSDGSRIWAVPELDSTIKDVELTHEAAVGRLAEDEIFYLLSRGMSRDEAVSTLVRGFLEVKVPGLPRMLEEQIKLATDISTKGL